MTNNTDLLKLVDEIEHCRSVGLVMADHTNRYLSTSEKQLIAASLRAQPRSDEVRCDRCGSSGDVFMMCSGCQSPLSHAQCVPTGNQVWEALKAKCAATQDKSKVKTLVTVRREDVVRALAALTHPEARGEREPLA